MNDAGREDSDYWNNKYANVSQEARETRVRECSECGDELDYWNDELCDWCDDEGDEEDE